MRWQEEKRGNVVWLFVVIVTMMTYMEESMWGSSCLRNSRGKMEKHRLRTMEGQTWWTGVKKCRKHYLRQFKAYFHQRLEIWLKLLLFFQTLCNILQLENHVILCWKNNSPTCYLCIKMTAVSVTSKFIWHLYPNVSLVRFNPWKVKTQRMY